MNRATSAEKRRPCRLRRLRTSSLIRILFGYVLQVTGGYTRLQCSLQILLYFVADRYSGPGERLLYLMLQTDTLGYSVPDRSLYTLSPTDIPVYTLGD